MLPDEVVLGVTTSGWVKVWTVVEKEIRAHEPILEHESKMIRATNALCLVCCSYNQRTVLVVTQQEWQVAERKTSIPLSSVLIQSILHHELFYFALCRITYSIPSLIIQV